MAKASILQLLEIVAPILPAPIYWEDINSKILGGNDAVFQATGAGSYSAYVGKTLFELYPENMASHIKKHNEEVMCTGNVLSQEEVIKDITSGDTKYFTAIKAPLYDDEGNVIGIVGTSIDITEEKRLLAALHSAKEKAEAANNAKSIFLTNISHDIRASLKGVVGLSKILEQSLENPKQIQEARLLHSSGEELLGMLEEILDDTNTVHDHDNDGYKHLLDLHNLAKQIAHDIRSPILALETICMFSPELTREKRELIKNTTKRINAIANNLFDITNLKKSQHTIPQKNVAFTTSLLNNLIQEKKIEYFDKNIAFEINVGQKAIGTSANISEEKLERCISNILNNAVEATNIDGKIIVSIDIEHDKLNIIISDNGIGIPPDKIEHVFTKGFSYNKKQGNGLGLSFAKQCIEMAGGSITIKSDVGKGTQVNILINTNPIPKWLCNQINCSNYNLVCILDDDVQIHEIWRKKMSRYINKNNIYYFFEVDSFLKFAKELSHQKILYLIDYQINGNPKNGLQIISQLNIQSDSVLMTGHYLDEQVVNGCIFSDVKLLPKDMLNEVKIFKRD